MPIAVMVKWDNYSGPYFHKDLFSVTLITRSWNDGDQICTRTQFPLSLAWAITIHKWQGMTLDKAVLNFGPKEFSAGLSYEGKSRVKSWKGVAIGPPNTFQCFQTTDRSKQLKVRLEEESRLTNLP